MITTRSQGMAGVEAAWDRLRKVGSQRSRDFPKQVYESHRELVAMDLGATWSDRPCFIVGGGPSLRGFEFSKLNSKHTIAVNRAQEYIYPTILFFMDNETFYQEVMGGHFGRMARERFINAPLKISLNITGAMYDHKVYSVPMSEKAAMTTDIRDGLFEGDNSGFAALNLAVCLRANPIYLLGFDMSSNGTGLQSWFHQGYRLTGKDSAYKRWLVHFEEACPVIKGLGIGIINLNPASALRCFTFGNYKDIT